MATVTVDPTPPATTGNPDWDRIVGPADTWVREALGEYAEGKEIAWEVVLGRYGQPPTYRLTISDGSFSAVRDLTAAEVADRREVRWQALRLWRRLTDQQIRDGFDGLIRGLGELAEVLPDGE